MKGAGGHDTLLGGQREWQLWGSRRCGDKMRGDAKWEVALVVRVSMVAVWLGCEDASYGRTTRSGGKRAAMPVMGGCLEKRRSRWW